MGVLNLVIIRGTPGKKGVITLKARAEGLAPAETMIEVVSVKK
jgi:hypothetical protein